VPRRVANEAELLAALTRVAGVDVALVDMAALSVADQFAIAADTDILVGEGLMGSLRDSWD
jgi:hypothetical protein